MKLHGASLLLKREIGCRYIETEPIISYEKSKCSHSACP